MLIAYDLIYIAETCIATEQTVLKFLDLVNMVPRPWIARKNNKKKNLDKLQN